jgi:uncharacterized protein YecE (DUF72 family)
MDASIGPGIRVGCAGWGLPSARAEAFPGEGTHLARYARRLACVEVNSSFYRPHQHRTYVRWAQSVPDGFRFAVKIPRQVTHEARLRDAGARIDAFAAQVDGLGAKLGPILVQLPPSLAYEPDVADAFFVALRARLHGPLVCEPRHPTWFEPAVDELWHRHRVGRVAADPARIPEAARPGGAGGVAYWRLHGSPRTYYDAYGPARLAPWAEAMHAARSAGCEVWAILDNTALGHAYDDAFELERMLDAR